MSMKEKHLLPGKCSPLPGIPPEVRCPYQGLTVYPVEEIGYVPRISFNLEQHSLTDWESSACNMTFCSPKKASPLSWSIPLTFVTQPSCTVFWLMRTGENLVFSAPRAVIRCLQSMLTHNFEIERWLMYAHKCILPNVKSQLVKRFKSEVLCSSNLSHLSDVVSQRCQICDESLISWILSQASNCRYCAGASELV